MIGEISGGHFETLHPPAVELVEAGFIPGGAEGNQAELGRMVETTEQLRIAQLEPFEQIEGVLGAEIGGHVIAVSRIAVEPAHVPHLELGAVRSGGVGGVDQFEGVVEITVVVVADLGNHKAGLPITDPACPDLQAIGGAPRHRHDAPVGVEQRQSNDPGVELGGQLGGGGALSC